MKFTKEKIRTDNDQFRKNIRSFSRDIKGRVVLTASVSEAIDRELIIEKVIEFDNFSADNDPHGEHDFGSFNLGETKYFFKIDYYEDYNLEYGVDPHEDEPFRVLTIMEASDY